jgi:hypothetical protein
LSRERSSKKDFSNISETFQKQNAKQKAIKYSHKTKKRGFFMNKNDQQFVAQKIRAQYMEKESTELDALRELDSRVKRPANIFAYAFGSVSAIVMGSGMSLVMTDIGATLGIKSALVLGIVIGALGLGMALLTYPIYKKILEIRKSKYSSEILALSDKIINK